MTDTATVTLLADFEKELDGLVLINIDVGPNRDCYALAVVDGPHVRPGSPVFRTRSHQPLDYRVIKIAGTIRKSLAIRDRQTNFTHIQPLTGGRLLLVCPRCAWHPHNPEKNALIVDSSGIPKQQLTLGDGIEDVQTDAAGRIWTSYFDEGVYGNYGWNRPIGSSGLVCWSDAGKQLYSFAPPAGAGDISDCYALNVASNDEVWAYYYTEFPLVRVHKMNAAEAWEPGLRGANALAAAEDRVLFFGDYDRRDTGFLYRRSGSGLEPAGELRFVTPEGTPLSEVSAVGRGPLLTFIDGPRCWELDIRALPI